MIHKFINLCILNATVKVLVQDNIVYKSQNSYKSLFSFLILPIKSLFSTLIMHTTADMKPHSKNINKKVHLQLEGTDSRKKSEKILKKNTKV